MRWFSAFPVKFWTSPAENACTSPGIHLGIHRQRLHAQYTNLKFCSKFAINLTATFSHLCHCIITLLVNFVLAHIYHYIFRYIDTQYVNIGQGAYTLHIVIRQKACRCKEIKKTNNLKKLEVPGDTGYISALILAVWRKKVWPALLHPL